MIIKKVFAQQDLGKLRGRGRLGLEGLDPDAALGVFTDIISAVIGIMTIGGGLWFLIHIIVSGYNLITAGGDSQKVQEAQRKIQNNAIGLFIIVSAIFILSLFGTLLNVPFLDFAEFIDRVGN